MDTYEINQERKAFEAENGSRSEYKKDLQNGGQWDFIIRAVCLGCGRTLGRYEINHNLAFCFTCRRILFPETVARTKSTGYHYPSPW